ncbi:SMC-Scp complex subunit ScpB [Candidatus Kaiserbacteria bacterium]|nr:SMC-Scp complex subunit ScpB [Candidatus Kaiserbacteria bacterium]
MTDLAKKIHALLFSEGGSVTKKRLAQLLTVSAADITKALTELSSSLEGGGLSLVVSDTEAALVISRDAADAVRDAREKELGETIGDAGLEVLSIVLYRGPSTRAQIDYIRGVNTASTVRNLLTRGLLERAGNPLDGREYLYRATVELLAHLGVKSAQDLPDYAKISSELAAFEKTQHSFDGDTADTMHDGEAH